MKFVIVVWNLIRETPAGKKRQEVVSKVIIDNSKKLLNPKPI
jgi:hypothetical protein